jgi:2-polyprenyl-3-methyl-5-hydroxy-6-metoxy-1,4-benzoquinol methylase
VKINKLCDVAELEKEPLKMVADEIRQLYSELKASNVEFYHKMSLQRLWEYAMAICYSGIKNGARVLDAGSGGSIFPAILNKKGCDVYVIDLENERINWTKGIASFLKIDLHCDVINMAELPFKKNFFDKIYSVSVIEHIYERERRKALKEMARVLKPGGIMVLSFDYDSSKIKGAPQTKNDIDEIINFTGLKILGNDFDNSGNGIYGILFLKKEVK